MGALHDGHASLIERAKSENHLAAASIFVNPTQFDDPADLAKYPRTLDSDIEKLVRANCDALLLPSVEEVYPPGIDLSVDVDLGGMDQILEGAHRTGHFQGVVQVVKRLLDIVQPDRLYMGQKDLQQFTICKRMIDQLALPVQIVRCPIVREPDGLAMSSRNVRLSPEMRAVAPLFYQTLTQLAADLRALPLAEAKRRAEAILQSEPFSLDYLQVCAPDTLRELASLENDPTAVIVATVRLGGVRLLDNVFLE